MIRRIGVCSWSLQPTSPKDLATKLNSIGTSSVQIALDPIRAEQWSLDTTRKTLEKNGILITSGMMAMKGEDYSTLETIKETGGVRLDEHWWENLKAAKANARIAAELGIPLVTFHAGFIPHESDDSKRPIMIQRLREIIDIFAEQGIHVAFETGQETAQTLLKALDELDRPTLGVNFDPANMILYDMGDPIEALNLLAQHILQIHIKDAIHTDQPGTWGAEVVVGTGQVDWSTFFETLREKHIMCHGMIEREAGNTRVEDISTAYKLIQPLI